MPLRVVLALALCACSSSGNTPDDAAQPPPQDAAVPVDVAPPSDDASVPSDPGIMAPPLDRSVPTTVFDATRFLYTGEHPIQTGLDVATIDARRVAVLRGRVSRQDLSPLSGATIAILGHPELGQTLSRADGAYDLVTNEAAGSSVELSQPALLYVENLLGFAPGTGMPVGSYDRAQGRWEGCSMEPSSRS